MQRIGRIYRRTIYYIQARNNADWEKSLPKIGWVVFTVANKEDEEMVPPAVNLCLDNDVLYTCSAGTLAQRTEHYFDLEICSRAIHFEDETKESFDYENSPLTTAHDNFSEGFWFAATLTSGGFVEIDKVVCIDFTKQKVKNHLIDLIRKIKEGWLPSDEEIELPKYDN